MCLKLYYIVTLVEKKVKQQKVLSQKCNATEILPTVPDLYMHMFMTFIIATLVWKKEVAASVESEM